MADISDKRLKQAIENTFFGDEDGQITLTWLLTILNHFAMTNDNPEVAIRQNIAKEILTMCNRWEGIDIEAYLNNLPRVVKEQEENE